MGVRVRRAKLRHFSNVIFVYDVPIRLTADAFRGLSRGGKAFVYAAGIKARCLGKGFVSCVIVVTGHGVHSEGVAKKACVPSAEAYCLSVAPTAI